MDGNRKYTKKDLEQALSILNQNKKQSLKSVAKHFNIPERTLRRHYHNPSLSLVRGPKPKLTLKEENALVQLVEVVSDVGVKILSRDLIKKANEIMEKKYGTTTKGSKWFRLFKKRNPQIVYKKPEKTDGKRLDVSIPSIEEYFEQMRKLRLQYNIPSDRIFNADETAIALSPNPPTSLGIKNKSRVGRTKETRENLTMMATISSSGHAYSPLFVWRGKTFNLEQAEELPSEISVSATPKGYMTGEMYHKWMEKFIVEANITPTNPAMLIIDSHESRRNLDAIQLAMTSGLHIVTLPGKMTHLLQPLDKSIFKVFKQKYSEAVYDIIETNGSMRLRTEKLTKMSAIQMATYAWREITTIERVKSSFEHVGIEPFAPNTTIDKIVNKDKRKSKELTNEELKEILKPTIIIERNQTKKQVKRIQISNKVLTSGEILEQLKQKREQDAQNKQKQKRRKKN